ncbi:DUF6378 domain-containing protein [Testudinibacter aquarius]|uniref:DUF6378 domain-containing protein n=1 Tax=Testudinibacter aquarius TaxID=1524974 RepID=A0A4R3Y8H9_9PAST|nr:DUF6378 domain-containing protein [Testudinibacter aquarius]KAE9526036.1 hypothetical protein A1D24_03120 [Testudinibacter aquarius]TCV87228.1 hypothetical protein EDC16_105147 [Testudinibacter aquarius]TNG91271.1 hypothetical protein FHQ21_08200 [Testudinibacter aquarius]
MENIKQLLSERESTHGDFECASMDFDLLHDVIYDSSVSLSSPQKYALTMIMVKITRILNGDPSEQDHWKDIAGYALLGGDLKNEGENEGDKS